MHAVRMRGALLRATARAGRHAVSASRAFSAAVDTESHDDFKPKKKTPAEEDPKGLFPSIEKTIKGHGVVLYMKGTPQQPMCGFSAQVVRILTQHGADIHGVNILEAPLMRVAMKEFSNWPTFPQLYVKGDFVGGCDIVTQMHQSGELKGLLESTGAVKAPVA